MGEIKLFNKSKDENMENVENAELESKKGTKKGTTKYQILNVKSVMEILL